jgi:hypothetical protein
MIKKSSFNDASFSAPIIIVMMRQIVKRGGRMGYDEGNLARLRHYVFTHAHRRYQTPYLCTGGVLIRGEFSMEVAVNSM